MTMIKALLLQLSNNMWEDTNIPPKPNLEWYKKNCDHWERYIPALGRGPWSEMVQYDYETWEETTRHFAECGGNMLVIDIGDALRYQSHPEVASVDAWSPKRMREELARLRDLGLEPIPKLNFSTCHDAWMHEYGRMVSSKPYYAFCHDVIKETCELFDTPRFFHLGLDEEDFAFQKNPGCLYAVVRSRRLWWHDINFYFEEVRRNGVQPWCWADEQLFTASPGEYEANMPKDVLQSNAYYRDVFYFPPELPKEKLWQKHRVDAYRTLDACGYDQVPCGSNFAMDRNIGMTVDFCMKELSREHLKGFLMAPWCSTEKLNHDWLQEACELCREPFQKV